MRHRPSPRLACWLLILAACAGTPPPGAPPLVEPAEPTSEAAAATPTTAAELAAELTFDPMVRRGRLANGLAYYIRANSKPQARAELWLAVNAGSMQEDDDQLGLAHFVEHMAFNGTEHFAKQELVNYLESIGMQFGPDINAFTSFDETVYTLTVPTDDDEVLAQAFQILRDWAGGVSLEGEEIDKERGVVVEEWRLGRGAEARIRDRQFPVLFKGSRYAERLPIGRKEILETAPHEALRRFYRDWYRPDLMAVIAIGDFDPDRIEQLIRDHFDRFQGPTQPRPREAHPVPGHPQTLYAITTDPEATLTSVGVYHKLEKRSQSRIEDYRRGLVEQLYHGMVNARLDELRQQADPPFLFAFSTTAGFVRSLDVYLQAAGVKETQIQRGLAALLTEVERVDQHGLVAGELERMKSDLLRRYEQAFAERDKRESQSLAGEYLRHFLEGEPSPGIEIELQLVQKLLPTIELAELNQLAREWISESNRVVLVSGPQRPELEGITQEELAEVFEEIESSQLEVYVDRVRDRPLLERLPTPSSVVETSETPEIGVTLWRLANGARVIVKPTDFKNDQVLVTGYSPGGHSLASDEEFASATFATSILAEGGLGEFDRVELEKALAGKLASIAAYLSELEEGIDGSASPRDLETMFQLLHLTLTAPRPDAQAFESLMTRLRTFVENRRGRPEAVFSDAITLARYRGHPRRRPPSLGLLAEISLETATQVYRERFADAGDFTFVLVGAFETEALRPLVETYIGGLPAGDRQESWRDVGADPVEGHNELEVHQGLEPKSQVRLDWTGEGEWSRENLHDIVSLASALRIRLREVLREDLGAVYGVGVSGSLSERPKQRFDFSIQFGCAPELAGELIDTVRQEIVRVRTEGLEPSYTKRVQEIQRRRRETNLEENEFWLRALKTYDSLGLDLRLILEYEALVERVTPDNLRQAAGRYLDPDGFFQAILYPEDWEGTPESEPVQPR